MIENIENKDIKSFDYEENGNSDGNITGVCELGKCTFEVYNKNNKYSYLNNVWIKTKFGEMYINDSSPNQASETIKFECYDARYKLDKEYDETLYSFPMTVREYRNAIFTNSGLLYSINDTFPHADSIIDKAPYIPHKGEKILNRDAMKAVSQATLSIVIKDDDDVFSFSWFNDEDLFEAKDCIDLTTDSIETTPLNLMILGRGNVEDNVYYPTERPEEEHQFRIDNNYILDDQGDIDRRYDVIQALYERINGFKFVVYSLRTTFIENKLNIKIGSKIKFYNRNGKVVESYVMNKKITYLGSNPDLDKNYEVTLSAEKISETSTDVSYGASIKDDLEKLEIRTNKNESKIQAIASKTDENTNRVNSTEFVIMAQGARLDVLGTNIDPETGNVKSVETGKGFTFDDSGLNISDPNEDFNTLITNQATQYKDGNEIITETSKDGFMTTDLREKGVHRYNWNGSGYDMVAERIQVDYEYAYAHFYNGDD